ncbi:AraC family transcriptional regulator [Apilactobacillus micheneri]|uniref:helix-turn-helix domain-containing protein n=1 Tax=Apilactobacillus micheneri TaxID=1899430 RepID=UPI00112BF3BF|nr:helix-turn-helix domain-containing protein [Apilactobacillus micheneri]TPR41532.1 AraC family transcriptional regulator [Apilactobacillus micheneri]TPR44344.1 AraC family transcriptional regulator [Apilactobacillus micheneri]TPR47908.1 AraC family transcriptional regulator [Apilactobacillus micheneri]TPR49358.1 AraC family transcriptional regulator [Apilactobacillus micheneri]
MKNYILDGQYIKYFNLLGIDIKKVINQMHLPFNFFNQDNPSLSEKKYYMFMSLVGEQIKNEHVPIKLATYDNVETFSPAIFTSYCSKNGESFITRLSQYKRLIAPIKYILDKNKDNFEINIEPSNIALRIPSFLLEIEFIFLVHVIRKATNKPINPKMIITNYDFSKSFKKYMSCNIVKGNFNKIIFYNNDLKVQFNSYNENMIKFLEPILYKNLNDFETDNSYKSHVQTTLINLLPAGKCAIEDVGDKLNISTRTLQRALKKEHTTFREQLNHTRKILAENYLQNTNMSSSDIAFLLGYQEINSFLRAFTVWTGKTILEYKKQIDK